MSRTLTLPAQKEFRATGEHFGPLIEVGASRGMLKMSALEILEHINVGDLAWAWDIGLGEHREEIRIYTKCVIGLQTTQVSCNLKHEPADRIYAQILASETKPFIEGSRLKDIFACSKQLIIDLLHAGELSLLPQTKYQRGRNGTPLITRDSVLAFLQKRRIT